MERLPKHFFWKEKMSDQHRTFAHCDGLLPKLTHLDGKPRLLWAIDCPRREECARYLAMIRAGEAGETCFFELTHYHAPDVACPDFVAEVVADE